MMKQKHLGEIEKFLEDNKDIVDVDTIVLYHDYAHRILEKFMQLTVYLWHENLLAKPTWMGAQHLGNLRKWFSEGAIATIEMSGLALLLWACQNTDSPTDKYDEDLGKITVLMSAHMIAGVFMDTRNELFSSVDEMGQHVQPKFNRPEKEPPRWMWEAVPRLAGANEIDFTRDVVSSVCMNPKSKYGCSLLTKKNKRIRITGGSNSPGSSPGAMSDARTRPLSVRESTMLKQRCIVVRFMNQLFRNNMNLARNQARKQLYRDFYFVVRNIQAMRRKNVNFKARGFWIEWHGAQDIRTDVYPSDLNMAEKWDIPEAKTENTTIANEFNKEAFDGLLVKFPSMKCTVHYICTVRSPAGHSSLKNQYDTEVRANGGRDLQKKCEIPISFYSMAQNFLQTLYHKHDEDVILPLLRTSKYSLRTLHIIALGIRGATADACGVACSPAEMAAKGSVTTQEIIDMNNRKKVSLMYGAKEGQPPVEGADVHTQESQEISEERLTTMTHRKWLKLKRDNTAGGTSEAHVVLPGEDTTTGGSGTDGSPFTPGSNSDYATPPADGNTRYYNSASGAVRSSSAAGIRG